MKTGQTQNELNMELTEEKKGGPSARQIVTPCYTGHYKGTKTDLEATIEPQTNGDYKIAIKVSKHQQGRVTYVTNVLHTFNEPANSTNEIIRVREVIFNFDENGPGGAALTTDRTIKVIDDKIDEDEVVSVVLTGAPKFIGPKNPKVVLIRHKQ